jgi:hypothetical protein
MSSLDEQVDAYIARAWSHVIEELRAWYDNTTHHGCFCGAGQRGTEPVDGLDTCCQTHDNEYATAGISADSMWWPPDSYVAGRQADLNLVNCATSAVTENDVYRERLIWLFSRRVDIADSVLWYRDRLKQFNDWLQSVTPRLLADGSVPPDVAAEYAQYVAYLEGEGIEHEDLTVAVADAGLDAAALDAAAGTGGTAGEGQEPTAYA